MAPAATEGIIGPAVTKSMAVTRGMAAPAVTEGCQHGTTIQMLDG